MSSPTRSPHLAARISVEQIEEGLLLAPRFDDQGLIPVVTTDFDSGEVLMHGYMNESALLETIGSGRAVYWSRTRQSLWRKGATSGFAQVVQEIRIDDDQDSVWLRVQVQGGASCHVGYRTCFYRRVLPGQTETPKPLTLAMTEFTRVFDPMIVYGDVPNPTKVQRNYQGATVFNKGCLRKLWFTMTLIAVPSCDTLLTAPPAESNVLDVPLTGINSTVLSAHLRGDAAFSQVFTPATGLGPVFNASACDSCHPRDGRGHPAFNLTRFGRILPTGEFDQMANFGGPQLNDKAIVGYLPEALPFTATGISVRGGPAVAGLGLIEEIQDEIIIGREDPNDGDSDGISGRAAFVVVPGFMVPVVGKVERNGMFLGRFGRKATAVSLFQQTVAAYFNDMGITSDAFPIEAANPLVGGPVGDGVAEPEVTTETVNDVVMYLRTLAAPPRREQDHAEVRFGENLFAQIGCASCHTPTMITGPSRLSGLAYQAVNLYSDLLLHDMGAQLADYYPEGAATGVEWRTTPLWGLGLVGAVLGGQQFYLHDGRATSLKEAILCHGGEAAAARERFVKLPPVEQAALNRFLLSL